MNDFADWNRNTWSRQHSCRHRTLETLGPAVGTNESNFAVPCLCRECGSLLESVTLAGSTTLERMALAQRASFAAAVKAWRVS